MSIKLEIQLTEPRIKKFSKLFHYTFTFTLFSFMPKQLFLIPVSHSVIQHHYTNYYIKYTQLVIGISADCPLVKINARNNLDSIIEGKHHINSSSTDSICQIEMQFVRFIFSKKQIK